MKRKLYILSASKKFDDTYLSLEANFTVRTVGFRTYQWRQIGATGSHPVLSGPGKFDSGL